MEASIKIDGERFFNANRWIARIILVLGAVAVLLGFLFIYLADVVAGLASLGAALIGYMTLVPSFR